MLIGDYCPRALEPIYEIIEAVRDLGVDEEALESKIKYDEETVTPDIVEEPVTELPCNVFGTVDRCDGMECEHDGNCFSGCCSLFVSGEQKVCMPLFENDLCPVAIDPIE